MRCLALLAVLIAAPACRMSLESDYSPPDAMISANCQAAKDELHPTAAFLEQKVYAIGCASSSCHDDVDPEDDLDVTAGRSWMSMVNVDAKEQVGYKLVVPGKPNESYLMMRVRQIPGAEMSPPLPDPVTADDKADFYMPQNNPGLCKEKLDAIQRWIEDGAPQ